MLILREFDGALMVSPFECGECRRFVSDRVIDLRHECGRNERGSVE
jgi:hypothetical protein